MKKSDPACTTPYFMVGLLHRTIKALSRHHNRNGRLPHAKNRVLMTLARHKEMSQNDLLEELQIRPSSLSELLTCLENEGMLLREKCEQDKRAYRLSLTELGLEVVEENIQDRKLFADKVFTGFSNEELETMADLLNKLAGNIKMFNLEKDDEPGLRLPSRYRGLEGFAHHGRRGRQCKHF